MDKARLLRRAIIISWASLAFCFIIKIFGGNFFEIICENHNYKALCDYADTHFWLKYLIGIISSMVCQTFFMLAILQKYKFNRKELVITIISVLICCLLKLFNLNYFIVADVWLSFILPAILLGKPSKKYFSIIIAFILNIGFQALSLFIKNIGFVNVGDTLFIGLIYSIDAYIMLLLYYLYRNYVKEQKNMGILWTWFMGKPIEKLKSMKAKREEKIAKLE